MSPIVPRLASPMAAQISLILPFVPPETTLSSPAKPKLRMSRARSATASSSVTIAPPSSALKNLVAWKLNTSARPKDPTMRSPSETPNACAASYRSDRSVLRLRSPRVHRLRRGRPHRWTPMIPVVCGVIARRTDSGSRQCVSGSMSAKIGVMPCQLRRVRCRDERVGRDDDLAGHAERRIAISRAMVPLRHRDAVPDADVIGDARLEFAHERAIVGQPAAIECALDESEELGAVSRRWVGRRAMARRTQGGGSSPAH